MLAHDQHVLAVKARASRGKAHRRRRPGRRLWVPEGLENRLLLSGGPDDLHRRFHGRQSLGHGRLGDPALRDRPGQR